MLGTTTPAEKDDAAAAATATLAIETPAFDQTGPPGECLGRWLDGIR